MSLKEVNIKGCYIGKGESILKEFLLPVISASTSYDRITSYFTVDSLLAISQGIQSLYAKQGKMRLLIGIHCVPLELVVASTHQKELETQIEKVKTDVSNGIKSIRDSLQQRQLATLAWMIQDHLLEVKVASIGEEGIFHTKTLIFKDSENNRVIAVGSQNETSSGLGDNYEQLMVAKSWGDLSSVLDHECFFNDLWSGKKDDVIIMDISEETEKLILNSLRTHFEKTSLGCDVITSSAEMPANFFVSGDVPSLFMHQERAVLEALSRWPVRVLFADEVGLGKTFEVASTMVFLKKYCNVSRILILTPKAVLKQWQDELYYHFGINAWMFDSSLKAYINFEGKIKHSSSENIYDRTAPDIVLMSAQYARGSKSKGSIFDSSTSVLPDLLIVDEAHSARVSLSLDGTRKKTQMYEMLERVAFKIPHLILATATPMQKDALEYHAMLKLLGLPKEWTSPTKYETSLKLIANYEIPDLTDAKVAYKLLLSTLNNFKPELSGFEENEIMVIKQLKSLPNDDVCAVTDYIQGNWDKIYRLFVKLHPSRLLTVRNTRESLKKFGYKFPKRSLEVIPLTNSDDIELFYGSVKEYLSTQCLEIEKIIYPDKKKTISFIKVSYMQRVASSLHSCEMSLKRRFDKVNCYKKKLMMKKNACTDSSHDWSELTSELDDFDYDDNPNLDINDVNEFNNCNLKCLENAIGRECSDLQSLIKRCQELIEKEGDKKVVESIKLAKKCLLEGNQVLVFTRYTDTLDALICEFKKRNLDATYVYGIYSGKESAIVNDGVRSECDKKEIKRQLFSGNLRILFCSDAASEGLNLHAARVLINVDVPWVPSRLEQRIGRIARLGQVADSVDVYNVWYPNSIEATMYGRIQQRLDESNLAVGDFPEIIAKDILDSILYDNHCENSLKELKAIRNSELLKALNRVWSFSEKRQTTSSLIRQRLIDICKKNYENIACVDNSTIIAKLPNKEEIKLTMKEGDEECISLKSRIWKDCVSYCNCLDVHKDGKIKYFVSNENGKIIKFESVYKICLEEKCVDADFLTDYPQMLPDNSSLDLSFLFNIKLPERPVLWNRENNTAAMTEGIVIND